MATAWIPNNLPCIFCEYADVPDAQRPDCFSTCPCLLCAEIRRTWRRAYGTTDLLAVAIERLHAR